MIQEQALRKRLTGSILLLSTLTEVPASPQRCQLPGDDDSRQLSIAHERRLARDFAFISALTNNPDRVTAVAFEENVGGSGCTIRIAANTGELGAVKRGFGHIGRNLEQVSLRSRAFKVQIEECKGLDQLDSMKSSFDEDLRNLQDAVFRDIVSLDWSHIVSRLRSTHARASRVRHRKPVVHLMSNAVKIARNGTRAGPSKDHLVKEIQPHIREIEQLFDSFEATVDASPNKAADVQLLMSLVKCFADLAPQLHLDRKIWQTRSHDPSTMKFLADEIGKLSRYCNVSRSFVDAARRKPGLFNRCGIEILPHAEADQTYLAKNAPSFDKVCNERIYPNLTKDRKAVLRAAYDARSSVQTSRFKVHAEIQLLFFYEQNPRIQRPRVLCSNKHACFLCHLFISLHGRCVIPRTHGRLYHQWALPEVTPQIATRMKLQMIVEDMESRLRTSIREHLVKKRRVTIHPNESLLTLISPISSTESFANACEEVKARATNKAMDSVLNQDEGEQVAQRDSTCQHENLATASGANRSKPQLSLDGSPNNRESESSPEPVHANPLRSIHTPQTGDEDKPAPSHNPAESPTSSTIRYDWTWQMIISGQDCILHSPELDFHVSAELAKGGHGEHDELRWIGAVRVPSIETFERDGFSMEPIKVRDLDSSTSIELEAGAAWSTHPLILEAGGSLFIIKYAFGSSPQVPDVVKKLRPPSA